MYLEGHVATVNLVGNGGVGLLTHPEQLKKFKENPDELAKGVVEETLRYWGSVDYTGRRIAKEDVEVGGTVIPKGEQATASLESANRIPRGLLIRMFSISVRLMLIGTRLSVRG